MTEKDNCLFLEYLLTLKSAYSYFSRENVISIMKGLKKMPPKPLKKPKLPKKPEPPKCPPPSDADY